VSASHGQSGTLLVRLREWLIATYLKRMVFPVDEVLAAQRPDIVGRSRPFHTVVIVDLSAPLEANFKVSYERKMSQYAGLVVHCRQKGWRCEFFVFEVRTQGFVTSSMLSLLKRVGISCQIYQKALRELSFVEEATSTCICNNYVQAKSSQAFPF